MEGLTVTAVSEFLDEDDQRWRQITFHDGRIVQVLLTAPWLVLEPEG